VVHRVVAKLQDVRVGGNEGEQPVLWLDGLDIPFVTAVDAVFYEEFHQVSNGELVQPVNKPLD
jgi:gentisate 1,2-dioxygenase